MDLSDRIRSLKLSDELTNAAIACLVSNNKSYTQTILDDLLRLVNVDKKVETSTFNRHSSQLIVSAIRLCSAYNKDQEAINILIRNTI